ncbi:MAG TPA: ABC transporter permease, partial [Candidatus Saccharimonadales bacterium]|nr:ABC transporter permease [Candidatus Saccharimonadales bacterium]
NNYDTAFSVTQIINSLVRSSLGDGWFTPIEAVADRPVAANLFPAVPTAGGQAPMYYSEFATADRARDFIKQEGCAPDFSQMTGPGDNPYEDCEKQDQLFMLDAYGSNSLGLDSAKRGFSKFFSIAGLVVAAIACIIMMGTVGKMIADSRRETAVFRAIGAKKLDIAQIYILYTIFVSVLIVAFAVLLGFIGALLASAQWSQEITIQALLAYNSQDLDKAFKLYSFYGPDMLYLLGIAVTAGLLSALFPLIRNLRRNPMRDMRDDT